MYIPMVGKVSGRWLGVGVVVMMGLAGAIALGSLRSQRPAYDVEALTVAVTAETITRRITASGKVQPVQSVNLSPKTTSRLERLAVEQGDRVVAGQIIAQMENRDLQAELIQAEAAVDQAAARLAELRSGSRPQEVAQAEAGVRQAEEQVRSAQARADLAQTRLNRSQFLQAEGAISVDDLDAATNEFRAAIAAVAQATATRQDAQERLDLARTGNRPETIAQAEAQLREAQGRLQAVQVRLEDTIIRAPFAGIITQKYATEGAFVTPTVSASDVSSATSTAIVALAQGLEVIAEVPEEDISQIQPGQRVEIIADAFAEDVFTGRVRLVAPEAIVTQTVTLFQVRIDLETGLDRLQSGMNVDITFLGDEIDRALLVPTVAIVTEQGETGVLVPGPNQQIRFQSVVIGSSIGNQTQILEGIQAGDRVFIDLPPGQRLENLRFGQPASPDPEEEETP